MSFNNQVAVVIGASGVVGSGVVRKLLDSGAEVVAVSRSAANLERLREQIKVSASEPFLPVVADFKDPSTAEQAHAAVTAALGGKPIDHIVSVQGFAVVSKAPTDTDFDVMKDALADGLYNNFLAAKVFLPALKDREGASFTLVSGGLAHFPPPNPALWLGTVKNAALNGLSYALISETAQSKVRVNTICIHFGVAPIGGNKNQFGMNADGDSLRLAPAFLGVARGSVKGKILCLSSWAEAEKLGE
jgi:NAD(P)-dependent dehydrogenase (short-subunit alcohol dehydrogenase family)